MGMFLQRNAFCFWFDKHSKTKQKRRKTKLKPVGTVLVSYFIFYATHQDRTFICRRIILSIFLSAFLNGLTEKNKMQKSIGELSKL